ncbi:hypothetical protein U9M48_043505 [Paspalum notatum var. saurae]|uniref:Reverse transcriptase Ty1/copia-type domain-containing protein n=1 Tax=Paspalum notatum var. saurae TaxID=547442 RepID=A0AAQ3UXK7_PASNO
MPSLGVRPHMNTFESLGVADIATAPPTGHFGPGSRHPGSLGRPAAPLGGGPPLAGGSPAAPLGGLVGSLGRPATPLNGGPPSPGTPPASPLVGPAGTPPASPLGGPAGTPPASPLVGPAGGPPVTPLGWPLPSGLPSALAVPLYGPASPLGGSVGDLPTHLASGEPETAPAASTAPLASSSAWRWAGAGQARSARVPRQVLPVPMAPVPSGAIPVPPVVNDHNMRTRAKSGFRQPQMNLQAVALSPVPSSFRHALADPNWRGAMDEEFQALIANNTWTLVPRPSNANIVTSKWIFRHKLHSDGTLDRYKARWHLGVDFDETFSPVVKPATILLSLALSNDWAVHQLDVKNAFLHGTLTETVYCSQSSGFVDSARPVHVCRLNKSLYGLKQAPRAWYSCFAAHLQSLGFIEAKIDTSLFIYRHGSDTAYLLLYVDDIVLTASSTGLLHRLLSSLQTAFPMKDLGLLHHFLGIAVTRSSTCMLLSQRQYALDILTRAGMTDCKSCNTPVDTQAKLSSAGPPVADPTLYRSLVGALQYLTFTHPDITYAVQQVCLHMHDPREPHLSAVKRILRYLQGTIDLGLFLGRSSPSALTVYTDDDWARCPDTRRSTSGY